MRRAPRVAGALTLALLSLGAAACTSRGRTIEPATDLDRALFYVESAMDGSAHPLSAGQPPPGAVPPDRPVERVPFPLPVDINSSIEVRLRKDELAARAPGPSTADTVELEARARAMRQLLELIDRFVRERLVTLERADALIALPPDRRSDPETRAFLDEAIVAIADFELALLDGLDAIWPEGSPEAGRLGIDELLGADLYATGLTELNRLADAELAELETLAREVGADVEAQSQAWALRLEAFLEARDAIPAPVHLPHYDRLPEQKVQVSDRYGLAMTAEQRARYRELADATEELARSAERVRLGEQTLEQAFSDFAARAGGRLGELTARAEVLAARLEADPLDSRLKRVAGGLEQFWEGRAAEIRARSEAAADEIETVRADLLARIAGGVEDPASRVRALLASVEELRAMAASLDPADVADLVASAREVLEQARDLGGNLADQGAVLLEEAIAELEGSAREIEAIVTANADLRSLFAQPWRESEARAEIESLAEDLSQLLQLLDAVARTVLGLTSAPPADPPRVPEVMDVPLEEAPDTRLDLQRTTRVEGDTLLIKATLLEKGEPVRESRARFLVESFGYHARLVPSVVLTEADQLAGGDDSGGFAPAVSWMHTWTPRPEDDRFRASVFRALEPGLGIHAVFLNYDQDNDPELGLGLTFSLWDDRIQVGVGANLQADGKDDGEVYYFFGSSLIPLLQSLPGFSQPGGGEKP